MEFAKPYPHPDDWMKEDPSIPLQETSLTKDEVWNKLTRYDGTIFTNLLNLFYFREFEDYFQDWSAAVFKSAFRVHKIKKSNGKDRNPSSREIYYWMWGGAEDSFDSWHEGFLENANSERNEEYQDLPYIPSKGNERNAGNFMKGYYHWLAKKLSKNREVSLKDVQDEIKLLFKKYQV
jgi:hypothetical protein